MDSKTIRYNNTRILVDQVGGVSNFANKINKGQSQTSQFAGTTPIKGIGNKVAREIEEAFEKPHGWLDVLHEREDALVCSSNSEISLMQNSNQDLQDLINLLNHLESKGKLSTDVIKALKVILKMLD